MSVEQRKRKFIELWNNDTIDVYINNYRKKVYREYFSEYMDWNSIDIITQSEITYRFTICEILKMFLESENNESVSELD